MHLNLFVLFLASGLSFCVADDKRNKTTTTTPATSTSTTTPSTTTPSTTTPSTTTPGSDSKLWFVNNTATVCVLFAANISITYRNKTEVTFSPGIHSDFGSVDGVCGGNSNTIVIPVTEPNFSIEFTFERNVTAGTFNITSVILNQTETVIPQSTFWVNNKRYTAQLKCNIKQTLFTNSNATEGHLSEITLSDMMLAVFQASNSTKFINTGFDECSADTSDNNLVPIIVGAILGGLILVVLIAYLIGRRRNRRGYESV